MNIIIPIGGIGQRFKDDGYLLSKPLIRFLGKPMIFWILDKIEATDQDHIYLVYHKELKKYNFKDIVIDHYQTVSGKANLHFIELFYQTEGAVETLLLALKSLEDKNKKVVSLDCDTFYRRDVVNIYRNINDNCVFYFEDVQDKPIYSYIKMNEDTKSILDIKEKTKISTHANTGCYCFNNGKILLKFCQELLDQHKELRVNKEYYVSSVIKLMLNANQPFVGYQLGQEDFVCLGTPHLLKIHSQLDALKQCSDKKRFCFDLDYTLVRASTMPVDYEKVEPIWKNINFLNFLKDQGHTIIIYTARRMRTHGGNVGKLIKDIGRITFDTLDKFGIQYDEIYFGKPYANYYIDDLSINSYHDLSKELGYYQLFIPERSSNHLKVTETSIIKTNEKSNLEGEIFWYQNIPIEISDLFPKLIRSEGKHLYEVEKVEGITLSHFYLNENLTTSLFENFLQQIDRIHQVNIINDNSDTNKESIYANYLDKLKQRYQVYDYTRFPNSEQVYQLLISYFTKYQNENHGHKGVIHGDPVFTNVIMTKMMKFKLIDMRGKLHLTPSIHGDILYDYAKIYQSLSGYDQILLDQNVNINYQRELLEYYENYLVQKFSKQILIDIKWIVANLLFTLIPIHDNKKCSQYYGLIEKLNIF